MCDLPGWPVVVAIDSNDVEFGVPISFDSWGLRLSPLPLAFLVLFQSLAFFSRAAKLTGEAGFPGKLIGLTH